MTDIRKELIARRDEWILLQKNSNGDRELAKFASIEAKNTLKDYRACCFLIPYFVGNPPKDCPVIPEWEWPVELGEHFDNVLNDAEIRSR